ncbi:MAG: 16S rRNA (cytosine(1402)-N(4))-methyltransferase RsmH [Candidatus Gracilibacteria bacterium]|nr:16S rRNA (cytosine(1402)-N(4))-methyltransferase RsmH [Candidatus Gracilibacteria bacterium]
MNPSHPVHKPVLLAETISALKLKPGMKVIDCTLGLGGHSTEILKKIGKTGRLLAIDQDQEALEISKEKLCSFKNQIAFYHGNFADLKRIVTELDFGPADALLADLGMSSYQLDRGQRGFSWQEGGPLDMRMDLNLEITAADLINDSSVDELAEIFRKYGELKKAKNLAFKIKKETKNKKITLTQELRKIVESYVPESKNKKKPLRQVFQALRIKVNDELGVLTRMLESLSSILDTGARVAIISFHSLEDRIVKEYFRDQAETCTCPPDSPICNCGKIPTFKIINKKAIKAGEQELEDNSRSRSAQLRIYEKL